MSIKRTSLRFRMHDSLYYLYFGNKLKKLLFRRGLTIHLNFSGAIDSLRFLFLSREISGKPFTPTYLSSSSSSTLSTRFSALFTSSLNIYCYCTAAPPQITDENVFSETLFRRRNIFREMGSFAFTRKFRFNLTRKMRRSMIHASMNRWSDCGCKYSNCGRVTKMEIFTSWSKIQFFQRTLFRNVRIMQYSYMVSWVRHIFGQKMCSNTLRKIVIGSFVDLLGFGESPKPRDTLYTLRDHTETIEIERSVIKTYQLDSFHVVAHSMGCLIDLALPAKHANIVKSVTLVAPPYFPSSLEGSVLTILAGKRLWPPLAFGTAVMSWYEHIGRCVCFIICKHHKIWGWLIKLCTDKREIHWKIKDITRHTHRSEWHSMHNVICGGSKFADEHLKTLIHSGAKIYLVQGDCDQIVPSHCSDNMKRNFMAVE